MKGNIDDEQFPYSYRISITDQKHIDDINGNIRKLRSRLQGIFYDRTKDADDPYSYLDAKCGIGESLFRKVLNGTRKITRPMLARFIVGLKLDGGQADELFELSGTPLNPDNALDLIIINAIRDRDEIDDFVDEVIKYTDSKI